MTSVSIVPVNVALLSFQRSTKDFVFPRFGKNLLTYFNPI